MSSTSHRKDTTHRHHQRSGSITENSRIQHTETNGLSPFDFRTIRVGKSVPADLRETLSDIWSMCLLRRDHIDLSVTSEGICEVLQEVQIFLPLTTNEVISYITYLSLVDKNGRRRNGTMIVQYISTLTQFYRWSGIEDIDNPILQFPVQKFLQGAVRMASKTAIKARPMTIPLISALHAKWRKEQRHLKRWHTTI